jgi:hypothetical protein
MAKSKWTTVGILSAVAIMLVDLGVIGLSAKGLAGAVALLAVIAIVPAIFWSLGLGDTGAPMDLPEGGARSVIPSTARVKMATLLARFFRGPQTLGAGNPQDLATTNFERILIDVAGR